MRARFGVRVMRIATAVLRWLCSSQQAVRQFDYVAEFASGFSRDIGGYLGDIPLDTTTGKLAKNAPRTLIYACLMAATSTHRIT